MAIEAEYGREGLRVSLHFEPGELVLVDRSGQQVARIPRSPRAVVETENPHAVVRVGFDEWRLNPMDGLPETLTQTLEGWMRGGDDVVTPPQDAYSDAPSDRSCVDCGHQVRDTAAAFCPKCGSALPAVQVEELLADLQNRLRQLEQRPAPIARWSWANVDPSEKWSVFWGIFGRELLVGVLIYLVILMLYIAAS